ncbi:MAG TPA: hypothetical protein VH186_24135 [Chloroflexia bacterium]|nr:hypothetical protein [Chloroflexia bacterium]
MKVRQLPRLKLNAARWRVGRRLPQIRSRLALLRKKDSVKINLLPEVVHPIIIVPGILGTWPPAPAPRGRLDPITRAYDNLLDALEHIGYVPGDSLFSFPYDWRRGIKDLAAELGAEIKRIRELGAQKSNTDSGVRIDYSKVDLLCHSMGGLVGRAYVQSDGYAGDVNRLVMAATPQKGAIAAYYFYEGGDSTYIGIPIQGAQGMVLLVQASEARPFYRRARYIYKGVRRRDLPDLYSYTRSHLHSVSDFLPLASQDYLYRLNESGQEKLYPFGPAPGYPYNSFLEELHRPDSVARLDRLSEIYCLYSSSIPTLARLQVEQPDHTYLYEHGQPVSPQPEANLLPGDAIVTVPGARLELPDTKPDGQTWNVKVCNEDVSKTLGYRVSHIQLTGDPGPIRHLLRYFVRSDLPPIGPEIWDGPLLNSRRPNYTALII